MWTSKDFFDNIDHELLMKAVDKHTDCKWSKLYIRRWLVAPVEIPGVGRQSRDKGTPQGGVISPLLANLFLHYAFDLWMQREYPAIRFERYADDIVIHCVSQAQATMLRERLRSRLAACKLEMSPSKTKIVYCKDGKRQGSYPDFSFNFLGHEFRPRKAKAKNGSIFLNYLPAISGTAAKQVRQTIRNWHLKRRTTISLEELARRVNPVVRGWINYYGKFYKSRLFAVLRQVDMHLAKWIASKHKRVRKSLWRAFEWLYRIRRNQPDLFAHWRWAASLEGSTTRAV